MSAPSLASLRRQLWRDWPRIVDACRLDPIRSAQVKAALPLTPKLLGSSVKVKAGESLGVISSVVYLAPAGELFGAEGSGRRTLCPKASPECEAACLGRKAGRMIMRPMERARAWKAALFLGDRALFRALLLAEAEAFARKARKAGMRSAIRVDGSSDTGEGQRLHAALRAAGVDHVWDYSKVLGRALRAIGGEYSLTFSFSGHNVAESLEVLRAGGGVAVVFSSAKGEALPSAWNGFPVVDGDVSDARFLDRSHNGAPASGGYVVGLRFKAAARRAEALAEAGPFVVAA
jgi:hypothetical protein